MNMWEFSRLTKLPMRQWHRFHVWRATRKLQRVIELRTEAEMLYDDALILLRKHASAPPCPLFDRLDNQGR